MAKAELEASKQQITAIDPLRRSAVRPIGSLSLTKTSRTEGSIGWWMSRIRSCLLGAILALGLLIPAAASARAASPCSADFAILGQMPALSGPTPTDWFNVTGESFDRSVPPTMAFGRPVIPYSTTFPTMVEPAITVFALPPGQDPMLGFKWTFRSATEGVQRISVRVAGKGCSATTLVDFAAPATSTSTTSLPGSSGPNLEEWSALVLALVLGGLAFFRRTRHARRTLPR